MRKRRIISLLILLLLIFVFSGNLVAAQAGRGLFNSPLLVGYFQNQKKDESDTKLPGFRVGPPVAGEVINIGNDAFVRFKAKERLSDLILPGEAPIFMSIADRESRIYFGELLKDSFLKTIFLAPLLQSDEIRKDLVNSFNGIDISITKNKKDGTYTIVYKYISRDDGGLLDAEFKMTITPIKTMPQNRLITN